MTRSEVIVCASSGEIRLHDGAQADVEFNLPGVHPEFSSDGASDRKGRNLFAEGFPEVNQGGS